MSAHSFDSVTSALEAVLLGMAEYTPFASPRERTEALFADVQTAMWTFEAARKIDGYYVKIVRAPPGVEVVVFIEGKGQTYSLNATPSFDKAPS